MRTAGGIRALVGAVAVVLVAGLVFGASPAEASSHYRKAMVNVTGWKRLAAPGLPGPNAADGVGPGSYLLIDQTDGNSYICTANFVWSGGGATYLGAAGHCFLPAGAVSAPTSNPGQYVTRVQACLSSCFFGGQLGAVIQGTFVDLGPVAYARQSDGQGNDVGHDFGMVRIPANVTPRLTVPVWGGPTGEAGGATGDTVCVYGNAAGLGELFATRARAGVLGSTHDGAWYATMPSFEGDSGSAVVECPGLSGTTALGILTHLATDGTGVIAGTVVSQAEAMVAADTGISISVVHA